jgi:hypothetical protein
MPTISRRYLSFVSQFVDAVTTSALDEAFEQARVARQLELADARVAAAMKRLEDAAERAA